MYIETIRQARMAAAALSYAEATHSNFFWAMSRVHHQEIAVYKFYIPSSEADPACFVLRPGAKDIKLSLHEISAFCRLRLARVRVALCLEYVEHHINLYVARYK